MYRLFEFIRRSYVTILFTVLEIIAVNIYIHSTIYTRARMLTKVYALTGGVATMRSDVGAYFSLARENRRLVDRVAQLENEVHYLHGIADTLVDEWPLDSPYEFIPARVVSNSVNRTHNFITLNRGLRDGVTPESAVISADGVVVGYILDCSEKYSVALSILNTSFRTSGKIEGSEYSGSIEWRGGNPYEVTMNELSKYADIEAGKAVVTTGFSHYFAPDMAIGTVESFELDETKTYYTARVRLSVDMSSLRDVLIVRNAEREELQELESRAAGGYLSF